MNKLERHPKIIRLAEELNLSKKGNCLNRIKDSALSKVEDMIKAYHIGSLTDLSLFISNLLSIKVELIETDDDIDKIIDKHPDFHSSLRQRLKLEFLELNTEGITLECEYWKPPNLRYLAVIDARGERRYRAYFTTWHEISHLLVHPAQKEFPGFRRTPSEKIKNKDPIESLVDLISGHIAFYEPFFGPVITSEIEKNKDLTFNTIINAKNKVVPDASLFATAIQSINYYENPTILIKVAERFKKGEERILNNSQQSFDFAMTNFTSKLRAETLIQNTAATKLQGALQKMIRDSCLKMTTKKPAKSGSTTNNTLETSPSKPGNSTLVATSLPKNGSKTAAVVP